MGDRDHRIRRAVCVPDHSREGAAETTYRIHGACAYIDVSSMVTENLAERDVATQMETFGMLISKSYLMIITPEEKILRDSVAQTIRVRSSQPIHSTVPGGLCKVKFRRISDF